MNKYNLFFYPNACHVCKLYGPNIILKRCGNCSMIAYCTKEHQKQHWPQHKKLCTIICSTIRNDPRQNNHEKFNSTTWTQWKMNFMLVVSLKMSRRLEHYEEQMFQFLRACTICYNIDTKELEDCPNCPCTSFCQEHKNDFKHKETCSVLKFSFNLDAALQNYKAPIPELEYATANEELTLPDNMNTLLSKYLKNNEYWKLSLTAERSLASEYLTRPLTLLYAAERLNYTWDKSDVSIHIVGADITEMEGIELWETFLHRFPNIKSIKLKLVGPDVYEDTCTINLCKYCTTYNKYVTVETISSLYESYVENPTFVAPDYVVGYNAGLHECENVNSEKETWSSSLKLIAKLKCPFVLTSYTKREAEKEQSRIQETLEDDIEPFHYARNPFSSLRPYRDFETESVYYQNQYIIIYERL